jgi:hypothetical protein
MAKRTGFSCWVPATPEQLAALRRAAAADGRTVGAYLVRLFLRHAEKAN